MDNKAGRPTKFKEEYITQAFKLAMLGATDVEMANFFEVAVSTFQLWKSKIVEFSDSIKKGKLEADANVASSLYHRAIGYKHKEVKTATFEGKITDEKEYLKHYPPDTTAAIFWLKNRQPKIWRDKTVLDTNIKIEQPLFGEDFGKEKE